MTSHHNRTHHPFCGAHSAEDPLECRLMLCDCKEIAADEKAYAKVSEAFKAEKTSAPSLAELTEKLGRIDLDARRESLARAEQLLAVPPEYQGSTGWVQLFRSFALVAPWAIWLGTSDRDDITAILNQRGSSVWPMSPREDEGVNLLTWGRVIHIHSLIERLMALQQIGHPISNPLAPLVDGCPAMVTASTRTIGRIIPGPLALGPPGDRRTQKGRFLLPAHIDPISQEVLPGLLRGRRLPSLADEFWEMEGGGHGGGQTAPISQRIFIECVLAVPLENRVGNRRVSYTVTMREFLSWLWPERNPLPSPSEYWPKLMPAIEDVERLRLPIINPETGRGRAQRIVSFPAVPRGPCALDDELEIEVWLPPGSEVGPQVSDRLQYWGTLSAPAWKALLSLPFLWWIPGRTLRPLKKGRRGKEQKNHWVRVYTPSRYPVLTSQDLVDICFPTTRNKADIRRSNLPRAIKALKELDKAGELRLVKLGGKGKKDAWQVLPPLPPDGDDAQ